MPGIGSFNQTVNGILLDPNFTVLMQNRTLLFIEQPYPDDENFSERNEQIIEIGTTTYDTFFVMQTTATGVYHDQDQLLDQDISDLVSRVKSIGINCTVQDITNEESGEIQTLWGF